MKKEMKKYNVLLAFRYLFQKLTGTLVLLVSALFVFSACQTDQSREADRTPKADLTLFKLLDTQQTGVAFENTLSPDFDFNILEYNYYYNGGGVAAADFDKDGLTDLYFTGNQVSGKLYLNKRNFKFEDITQSAGVSTHHWATGVAVVDINQDGWQDLYVCYAGYPDPAKRVNQFFINQGIDGEGKLKFIEQAEAYGLADTSYTTHAAFLDYDKDGDLDLYLLNHYHDKSNPNYPKKKVTDGTGKSNDKLFRNNGDQTFTDITKQAGIVHEGYGLGISIADINQDGWPDIYIANDFVYDDLLYINDQNGAFTESIRKYLNHTSRFSMGVDVADYNNDTYTDIIVLDMLPDDNRRQKLMNAGMNLNQFKYALQQGYLPQYPRNVLQYNHGPDWQGNYSFSEIGQLAGIYKTDWSWSPLLADLDNDGWKDLFITNGIPKDITNNDFVSYRDSEVWEGNFDHNELKKQLLDKIKELENVNKPNFVFKNNGDLTFTDQSTGWGLAQKGFSNGAVYADLDNDGDLDLVTNNLNATPFIFKNQSEILGNNHYLRVKPEGYVSTGAKIILTNAGNVQLFECNPYKGFQSSQEAIAHFGLGKDTLVDQLEIFWPDGKYQAFTDIPANQLWIVDHKEATESKSFGSKKEPKPVFTNISSNAGIDFVHQENEFEDFNHEPLLPHRYSRNGPYIATGDVDGNGLEDFYIGGSAGNAGQLFLQQQQPGKKFSIKEMPDAGFEDMGTLFFDADGDQDLDLYVVSGGSEYNALTATYQDRLYFNDGKGSFERDKNALPLEVASGSCVRAHDYDKDGDLDLFIGGRIVPSHYPVAAESFILRNNGKGTFENVTSVISPELQKIGLVTDAIWSDFDNDQWVDLIVVGEWMPVTFFKNQQGKLVQIPPPGNQKQKGWWFSIAAGDFDKDGDMDYIVGNLGLNSKLKASDEEPVSVYVKDFNKTGTPMPVLTYYLDGEPYTVAGLDQIASRWRAFRKKFNRYSQFAEAGFAEIFTTEELEGALRYDANTFQSVYLENKGKEGFVFKALPVEAQFAPIKAIQTGDFDKDGHLDVLLAGNFYSPEIMIGQYDASIGLMLQGDGKGNFNPLSPAKSGIRLAGEVQSMIKFQLQNKSTILCAINAGKLQVLEYVP